MLLVVISIAVLSFSLGLPSGRALTVDVGTSDLDASIMKINIDWGRQRNGESTRTMNILVVLIIEEFEATIESGRKLKKYIMLDVRIESGWKTEYWTLSNS